MRVLFVTHNIPRHIDDAAGSFVLQLALALREAGVRIDVIAPGGTGLREFDSVAGISIHRVPYASDAAMTLAYTGTMAESIRASWRARWALLVLLRATRRTTQNALRSAQRAGDPYDLVHVHWWFPSGFALWRGLPARKTRVVLTMHGSDVRLAQKSAAARSLMRRVLRGVTVRTAVSSWLAEQCTRVSDMQVYVAPMPVDIRRFDRAADDGDMPARDGVLFVGRLNRQKGMADLLQALALPALREARLTVAGDGADAAALKSLAVTLGIGARVRWLGVQTAEALAALYRSAVVVAMPSTEEGLGLVAVEAQLCGTPVVAYASGGLPDVVRADAGGALVPVGDVDILANELQRCLEQPDDAARRGQVARDAVRARFAPVAVAQRYLAVYDEGLHEG